MNRSELIREAAKKSGVSKEDAEKVFAALLETTIEAINRDEYVSIMGYGYLETKVREERLGRNPMTGETIRIPARKILKFKAGKFLLGAVRQ